MNPMLAGAAISILPYIAILFTGGLGEDGFFAANNIYNILANALWSYVVMVLIARAIYSALTFQGSSSIWNLMRDLIAYVVLIYVTPSILATLFQSVDQLASLLTPEVRNYADPSTFNFGSLKHLSASFDESLFDRARVLSLLIGKALNAVHDFAIHGLFAAAPLMIFMGTILGFETYRKSFFTLVFSVSIWPIISAILQTLAFELYKFHGDGDLISKSANLFMYSVLQAAVPFFSLWQAKQAGSSVKNLGVQAASVVTHGLGFINGDSRKKS